MSVATAATDLGEGKTQEKEDEGKPPWEVHQKSGGLVVVAARGRQDGRGREDSGVE